MPPEPSGPGSGSTPARQALEKVLGLGAAGLGVFLLGLFVGGAVVYGLHIQHWLPNPEVRRLAAFSEVSEPAAGDLAEHFRPWLKFDSQEQWRPLSISELFRERNHGAPAHEFCQRTPAQPSCTPIKSEDQFTKLASKGSALGRSTYIDLAGSKLDDYHGPVPCDPLADCGTGPASAIYYHVTESNDRFYIDYWWFLRFNHFYRSSPSFSCLSAFARENGICDEHEGDWEGVTEVTAPGDDTQLDYVVYAAHKGTFRYSDSQLKHQGVRPVVYVARGSHASYPQACPKSCDQPISLAAQGLVTLPESSFDGAKDWARDGDHCPPTTPGSCLLPLPRADHDTQAWTRWQGQWGAGCGDACHGQSGPGSPPSPGLQSRYQTPWCSTQGTVFTCDGRTLGCSDWLGPLVVAVACDPAALAAGLKSPYATSPGDLVLTVRGEQGSSETTPGVVQTLGDPLTPGDTVTVGGGGPGVQALVRAQQGRHLVEARFALHRLGDGRQAVITVSKGKHGPRVLLNGHTPPLERRVLRVPAPTKGR